jgi:hypothetical protein
MFLYFVECNYLKTNWNKPVRVAQPLAGRATASKVWAAASALACLSSHLAVLGSIPSASSSRALSRPGFGQGHCPVHAQSQRFSLVGKAVVQAPILSGCVDQSVHATAIAVLVSRRSPGGLNAPDESIREGHLFPLGGMSADGGWKYHQKYRFFWRYVMVSSETAWDNKKPAMPMDMRVSETL